MCSSTATRPCYLRGVEQVRKRRLEITVTKRGLPEAKLGPFDEESPNGPFGYMCRRATIVGALVRPKLCPMKTKCSTRSDADSNLESPSQGPPAL